MPPFNSGELTAQKVDHNRWVARRVALNATQRGELFGTVAENDRRPYRPNVGGIRVFADAS
jgi:hypothetical protein